MRKALISEAILLPIYLSVGLFGYWEFVDTELPSDLTYQHDKFLSAPVSNKHGAREFSIEEAAPGQTVYRYIEYSLKNKHPGLLRRTWTCGDFVLQSPVRTTIGEVGEHKRSIPHTIPPFIAKPTICRWEQRIEYKLNPIKTVTVDYPPITIKVVP